MENAAVLERSASDPESAQFVDDIADQRDEGGMVGLEPDGIAFQTIAEPVERVIVQRVHNFVVRLDGRWCILAPQMQGRSEVFETLPQR